MSLGADGRGGRLVDSSILEIYGRCDPDASIGLLATTGGVVGVVCSVTGAAKRR